MQSVGSRVIKGVDYRSLVGMSNKAKNEKAGSSRRSAGSVKSKKHDNEVHSKEEEELEELRSQLDQLQDKIDNNPAYVAEVYEKVDKAQGSTYVTEEVISERLSKAEAKF